MLKEGMYVRCPYDQESKEHPRVFMCGRIKSIDEFKNTVIVEINDPFETIDFFPNLVSGILEYPIVMITRCTLFDNSIVIYDSVKSKVLGHSVDGEGYYTYYLQDLETKKNVKACEKNIIAAFNNGRISPHVQLRKYEFQNPIWYFGRNIVSKNINLLNNSVFGFKELAGSKIYLMPHQINTIMRCLQDSPCRYMLADEVGMGKTIEAISILKIYLLNKSKQRVLIVVPDALEEQWKTELFFKFNITIGQNKNGNIVGLKTFSSIGKSLTDMKWNFVVMDEVHRLLQDPMFYENAHKLSKNANNILILSATPVQDRQEEYLSLLRLLQPTVYDKFSLDKFKFLIQKQKKIVQKTSFVLSDLETFLETVEESISSSENPRDNEDCKELFDEMQNDLEEICDELNDEKLNDLFKKVSFDSEDYGVYDLRVLVSYICGNYQLENNIIRNRRKMLEMDDEHKLPMRKLIEVSYSLNSGNATAEAATYNALIRLIDVEIDKTDDAINNIVKPLLNSFFSSPQAFLKVANKLLNGLEGSNEIFENAREWYAYESFILNNIVDILDDPDKYAKYYSSRMVSIFNFIYDNCNDSKIVIFTDFEETFELYKMALETIYDEDEIAFFGKKVSIQEAELNAYKFQNDDICSIMCCDYTGGEGRNFQCADFVIHIDIPWDANMIEQRIGRLDRLERDKNRPIVNSVVVYAEDTFENALFKFWRDGLQIFTQSLSGMEIIMKDINSEINVAIKEDLKYGLFEKIEDIVLKAENMRKEIKKEQNYDAASFIFRPMYLELNKLVSFYNRNENALFADTMASWAGLAGFNGQISKAEIVTYSAGLFSPKSAINAQLIPPRWKDYLNENQNQFLDRIQSQYDEKKEKTHLARAIRGTFVRKIAIENDYIHFFAPGDAVFDCIVDNAIYNCKGQSCSFEVKSQYDWTGFVFIWSLKPDEAYLIDNNISLLSLAPYRTYVATDQIITVIALSNPDDISDENIIKEYKKLCNQSLSKIKKVIEHLGKRSETAGINKFVLEYPSDIWNNLIMDSFKNAQTKAVGEMKKRMNIKGAKEEMQRSLSALNAKLNYYDLNQKDLELIKKKQSHLLNSLRKSKVYLDSTAFMRMVKNDD